MTMDFSKFNNKIILINGSGGSGKSTFCSLCKEIVNDIIPNINIKVYEFSTIDWPKEVARFCGWQGQKTEKDRKFLSDLKEALERWDNSPELKVFQKLLEFNEDKENYYIVFVNCREPKNILNFIKKNQEILNWEIYTLLIKNNNIPQIISNIGDASVYNYNYDKIINNDKSLNELKQEAKKYLEEIIF